MNDIVLPPKNSAKSGGKAPIVAFDTTTSPKVTTGDKVAEAFPQTEEAIQKIMKDPLSIQTSPKKNFFEDAADQVAESIKSAGDKWADLFTNKGESASKKFSEFAGAATGTVGAVFSPISALLKNSEDIPVLGTASKIINGAFTATGEAATGISNKIIDALPIKDPETKQHLKEGFGEISALAAQMWVGELLHSKTSDIKESLDAKYGKEDAETIKQQAADIVKNKLDNPPEGSEGAPVKTGSDADVPEVGPKKPFDKDEIAYLKKYGFSPDQISKLEKQARVTEGIGEPKEQEPVKPTEPVKIEEPIKESEPAPAKEEPTKEGEPAGGPQKEEPTNLPKGKAGVGLSLRADAIEKGLSDTFEGTAEYDKKTVKQQATDISEIMSDRPRLENILEGREDLPKTINPAYLIATVEKLGDWELNKKLMKSKAVTQTAEAAQTMRFLQERDPESPLAALDEIKKNRKQIEEKQGSGKIKKSDLTDFIKKLEC